MIIGKDFKSLYQFLKKVYDIFNKGNDNTILYCDEQCILRYAAVNLSGSIELKSKDVNVLIGTLESECFYELVKMPRDRFKLKPIIKKDITDEMVQQLNQLDNIFNNLEFVCDIYSEDGRVLSKLTRLSNRYISDSYIKLIHQFGRCGVFAHGLYIVLKKEEWFEKEEITTTEDIAFFCETFKSVDENIQAKMNYDKQNGFASII